MCDSGRGLTPEGAQVVSANLNCVCERPFIHHFKLGLMLDFRKNLLNQSNCRGARMFPECRGALPLGGLPEETLHFVALCLSFHVKPLCLYVMADAISLCRSDFRGNAPAIQGALCLLFTWHCLQCAV